MTPDEIMAAIEAAVAKGGSWLTPRVKATGERTVIRISYEDSRAFDATGRKRGYRVTVTDLDTGKRYKVYGAACSLSRCVCDAVIDEERPRTARKATKGKVN